MGTILTLGRVALQYFHSLCNWSFAIWDCLWKISFVPYHIHNWNWSHISYGGWAFQPQWDPETSQEKVIKSSRDYEDQANKKHIPHHFTVNDFVYVKLRPHSQISLQGKGNHNLIMRFYGPFKTIQQIDDVAFKLELPAASRIHPVSDDSRHHLIFRKKLR